MQKVLLELPSALAEEARKQGLLTSEALQGWLEEVLKKRQVDDFFSAADRLAEQQVLNESDIEQEVIKARQERSCA